jgi:hypothetical protein
VSRCGCTGRPKVLNFACFAPIAIEVDVEADAGHLVRCTPWAIPLTREEFTIAAVTVVLFLVATAAALLGLELGQVGRIDGGVDRVYSRLSALGQTCDFSIAILWNDDIFGDIVGVHVYELFTGRYGGLGWITAGKLSLNHAAVLKFILHVDACKDLVHVRWVRIVEAGIHTALEGIAILNLNVSSLWWFNDFC